MTTNTKHSAWLDIIGWIGTACILIGYGLFSTGIVPDAVVYHALNLVGSIGVAALSYHRKIWQTVVINVVFAIFASIALMRFFL